MCSLYLHNPMARGKKEHSVAGIAESTALCAGCVVQIESSGKGWQRLNAGEYIRSRILPP